MNTLRFKAVSFLAVVLVGLSVVAPAFALTATGRAELKAEAREDRAENLASRPGLLRDLANRIFGRAAVGSGILTKKSGDTIPTVLTVTGKNGKVYSVNISEKTQLRRRFWGKATLDEFQIGDTLNIIGQWKDDAQTTIDATLIRDASIQKRFGVFIGEVVKLVSNGWIMKTIQHGDQSVTVGATTKFVNRKGQTIVQTDIKAGDRVRVRGLWDRITNTVTEVTGVKDYSLPVVVQIGASESAKND